MTTGEKIRQLRLEKGWTQSELAEKCGYSGKSVICKTETAGNNIGTKKLVRIAYALGVSPNTLVNWESDETYDGNEDIAAIYDFVKSAPPDAVHQLRLYADFLKNRGDEI